MLTFLVLSLEVGDSRLNAKMHDFVISALMLIPIYLYFARKSLFFLHFSYKVEFLLSCVTGSGIFGLVKEFSAFKMSKLKSDPIIEKMCVTWIFKLKIIQSQHLLLEKL